MNERLFQAILVYGNRYCEENIFTKYTREQLLSDWRIALMYFFSRVCYQGRRDELSEKVYKAVEDVLKPSLSFEGAFNNSDLELWEGELRQRIGKGKVGKGRDVDMIISALRYVGRLPERNIVSYSLECIKGGKVVELYDGLRGQASESGITQVGEKTASFFLRDTVTLYQLENVIPQKSLYCLQPIDTRVRQLASKLSIVNTRVSDFEVREAIIKLCIEQKASSLLFNQGAWYLSIRSFDLLIDNLERHGL